MTTQYLGLAQLPHDIETQAVSRISTSVTKKIKERYGFGLKISRADYGSKCIDEVNEWIKSYDPKFKERLEGPKETCLRNTDFIINLDTNTFASVIVGTSKIDDISFLKAIAGRDNSSSTNSDYDIKLYIFGKKAKKYSEEINNILKEYAKDKLYMYSVSGGTDNEEFNSIISDMHLRSMNTLFFDNSVKEKVIAHIQSFLDNREIYEKRDLLYKTGILLYGDPGTGKSSLANAIATHFNDSLIVIDMASFDKLDVNTLSQSINADDNQYVILLEDVDCIFKSLDRTDDSNITKDDLKIVNKLLQFTDSNSSPNNVIFVATTNHYDKLDAAITRSGRFDLQIEVKGISKETAIKMCKSFDLTDKEIDNIIKDTEFPVNQSKLQEKILKAIKNSLNNKGDK